MINRIVVVGRLARDAELRKTTTGTSVASFTVAVDNRPIKGQERSASFIPCVAWNQTAENVFKYTRKGSLVSVDGRLVQRTYEKRDGTKGQVFEIVCDIVQFLDPKGETPSASEEEAVVEDDSKNLDTVDIIGNDLPF